MNGFLNKNLKSYAKNWLSSVKYAEMQLKNAVRNQYNNYIQKEKDLYSKIQQLRKQKHLDGIEFSK